MMTLRELWDAVVEGLRADADAIGIPATSIDYAIMMTLPKLVPCVWVQIEPIDPVSSQSGFPAIEQCRIELWAFGAQSNVPHVARMNAHELAERARASAIRVVRTVATRTGNAAISTVYEFSNHAVSRVTIECPYKTSV